MRLQQTNIGRLSLSCPKWRRGGITVAHYEVFEKERTLSGQTSEAAVFQGVASHSARRRPLASRVEESSEATHATCLSNGNIKLNWKPRKVNDVD